MRRTLLTLIALAVVSASTSRGQSDLSYNTASTLTLSGPLSYANVGVGVNGGGSATIVDAAATTGFTAGSLATPASYFYVGVHTSNITSSGKLQLGSANSIFASQVTVGGSNASPTLDPNQADAQAGVLTTAANGTTTINAANIAIGAGKARGTQFGATDRTRGGVFTLGTNATLNVYGITGSGSRANLVVGRLYGDGSRTFGTMDLSAGTANLVLGSLFLSRTTTSSGVGDRVSNSSMTLSSSASNHLDVSGAGNVVQVGYNMVTGSDVPTTAVLTIGNLAATSSVTSTNNDTAIVIGYKAGTLSGTTSGTLNLEGGTLTITTTGAAIAGGGGNTAALNLGGASSNMTLRAGASSSNWIHSLTNADIKAGGATINSNGFNLGVSQAFSGVGGLTKAGVGRLTLSGANTYAGTTAVTAGVLDIASSGSISNSSPLTLSGGTLRYNSATTYTGTFTPTSGTLGGTNLLGSLGGQTIGAGLTLSPGNSPGTATTTSQTWAGGGTYVWEINSVAGSAGLDPGWDLLFGSDTLTVSATSGSKFTLAITSLTQANASGSLFDFDPNGSYTWKIADFANPVSGFDASAFQVDTTGFTNPFTGTFNVALGTSVAGGDNTEVYVTYAVPEPATLGLAGAAAIAALAIRRRQRIFSRY